MGLKASQSLDLAETALFLGDSLTAGEWLGAARGKVNAEDDSLHIDDLIQPWERAVRLVQQNFHQNLLKLATT